MESEESKSNAASKYLLVAVSWLLRGLFALGAVFGINALISRDEISSALFAGTGVLAGLPWSLLARIFPHSDLGEALSAAAVWIAAACNYRWVRKKLLSG